jgi:hypothetical protein
MGMLEFGANKRPVRVCEVTVPATASAAAVTGAAAFMGIMLQTNGVSDVTLDIYDNTAASGSRVIPTNIVIKGGPKRLWTLSLDPGVRCATGIYVNISGTPASYQVLYDQG